MEQAGMRRLARLLVLWFVLGSLARARWVMNYEDNE